MYLNSLLIAIPAPVIPVKPGHEMYLNYGFLFLVLCQNVVKPGHEMYLNIEEDGYTQPIVVS